MKIKVNDKYRISTYNLGWQIEEKSIISKEESKNYGKEVWKTKGYYNNDIENVLRAMQNILIKESVIEDKDVFDVENIILAIQYSYRKISKIAEKCYKASEVNK